MSELPIFVFFLLLEISLNLFESLLLKHLLDLCPHSTNLFVLLELILIQF